MRESLYFCRECKTLYCSDRVKPIVTYGGLFQFRCPSYDCKANSELIRIDEMIAIPIRELNAKGYHTKYCCSGHFRSHPDDLSYIYFEKGTYDFKRDGLPKGWFLDEDNENIIRSHKGTIWRRMDELNKWIQTLPNIKKGRKNAKRKTNGCSR